MDRKAQGLSLNVIIIAALALIVLVVLIMIFTGRIGLFDRGVQQEGQADLIKLKILYGQCRPTATQEASFTSELSKSESVDDQEAAKAAFQDEISRCKSSSNSKVSCEDSGCRWG